MSGVDVVSPELPNQKPRWQRHAIGVAKYAAALLLVAYVLLNAEVERVLAHAKAMNPLYIALAFLSLNAAQWFSTLRMNYYYRAAGRALDFWYSLKLYYVGMVYNVILPGGIGGDAYKVYLLKKVAGFPVGEGIRLQLSNRASGLLILILFMLGSLWFMRADPYTDALHLAALMWMLATVLAYFLCVKWVLKEKLRVALGALPYSAAVQMLTLGSLVALWAGTVDRSYLAEFIFLFNLASIMGMVPISIGGLGLRELTFFVGAGYMGWLSDNAPDPELGVALSLCFFGVTLASSLIGLVWIHRIRAMPHCKKP